MACCFARAGIFLRRSQILEELADPWRADPLLQKGEHLDATLNLSRERGDDLTGMDITRRLYALPVNLHMARVAGLNGQGAAFIEPHSPEPFIETDVLRRFHGKKTAVFSQASR